MTDHQIKVLIGAVAFLALFFRIPKIDLPVWKWILQGIGDAITGSLKAQIADLSTQITEVDRTLNRHIKSQEEAEITACRRRILTFDDECRRGLRHGEENWQNTIDDVDTYTKYCREHPLFSNSKAERAMSNLKDTYNKLTPQDFL